MLLRLAVLTLCCLMPAAVSAQTFQIGGPGGANFSMPKYMMLYTKAVKDELKITAEQDKKIQAKIKELTPEGGMVFAPQGKEGGSSEGPKVTMSFSFKSADGNGAASPPVAIDGSKLGALPGMPDFKKIDEEVNKLLEQPQRDRLKQLALQRQGLSALAQDDVAREVQLEAEQKEMVKHILDDQRKKTQEFFQEMMQNNGGQFNIDRTKVTEHMKKQREQTESDLAIVLSPEQKTKWEELQGPKFDFKKP
jgi:DNA gyrase/topoisomerase IV subunit A